MLSWETYRSAVECRCACDPPSRGSTYRLACVHPLLSPKKTPGGADGCAQTHLLLSRVTGPLWVYRHLLLFSFLHQTRGRSQISKNFIPNSSQILTEKLTNLFWWANEEICVDTREETRADRSAMLYCIWRDSVSSWAFLRKAMTIIAMTKPRFQLCYLG